MANIQRLTSLSECTPGTPLASKPDQPSAASDATGSPPWGPLTPEIREHAVPQSVPKNSGSRNDEQHGSPSEQGEGFAPLPGVSTRSSPADASNNEFQQFIVDSGGNYSPADRELASVVQPTIGTAGHSVNLPAPHWWHHNEQQPSHQLKDVHLPPDPNLGTYTAAAQDDETQSHSLAVQQGNLLTAGIPQTISNNVRHEESQDQGSRDLQHSAAGEPPAHAAPHDEALLEDILSPISPILVCTQGAFHDDEPSHTTTAHINNSSTTGPSPQHPDAYQSYNSVDMHSQTASGGHMSGSHITTAPGGRDTATAAADQAPWLDSLPIPNSSSGEGEVRTDATTSSDPFTLPDSRVQKAAPQQSKVDSGASAPLAITATDRSEGVMPVEAQPPATTAAAHGSSVLLEGTYDMPEVAYDTLVGGEERHLGQPPAVDAARAFEERQQPAPHASMRHNGEQQPGATHHYAQVPPDIPPRCSTDESGRKIIPVVFTGPRDLLATEHKQTWTPCLPVDEAMAADVEIFASMPHTAMTNVAADEGGPPVGHGYHVNPSYGRELHCGPGQQAYESSANTPPSTSSVGPTGSSHHHSAEPNRQEAAAHQQGQGHTHNCVARVASAAAGLHVAGEPLQMAATLAEAALHPAMAVDGDSAITSLGTHSEHMASSPPHPGTTGGQFLGGHSSSAASSGQQTVPEGGAHRIGRHAGDYGGEGVVFEDVTNEEEGRGFNLASVDQSGKVEDVGLSLRGLQSGKEEEDVDIGVRGTHRRGEGHRVTGWPNLPSASEIDGGVPSGECEAAAKMSNKARHMAFSRKGHSRATAVPGEGGAGQGSSLRGDQEWGGMNDEELMAAKEEVNEVAAAAGALAHMGQHVSEAAAAAEVAYHPDELVDMMCSLTNQPGSNIVPLARAIAAIEHLGGAAGARGAQALGSRENVFPAAMHRILEQVPHHSPDTGAGTTAPGGSADCAAASHQHQASMTSDAELEDITSTLSSTDQAPPLLVTDGTDHHAGFRGVVAEGFIEQPAAEEPDIEPGNAITPPHVLGTTSGLGALQPPHDASRSSGSVQLPPAWNQDEDEMAEEGGGDEDEEVLAIRTEVMQLAASAAALSHLGQHIADAAAAAELARHAEEVMDMVAARAAGAAVGIPTDTQTAHHVTRGLIEQVEQGMQAQATGGGGTTTQVVYRMSDNQLTTSPRIASPRITPAGMDDAGVLRMDEHIQETEMGMASLLYVHDQVAHLVAAAAGLHLAHQPVYRAANMAEVLANPAHVVDFDSALVSTANDDQGAAAARQQLQQPHGRHIHQGEMESPPAPAPAPTTAAVPTTAMSPFAGMTHIQPSSSSQTTTGHTAPGEAGPPQFDSYTSEDVVPANMASQVTLDQVTGLPAGDHRNLGVSMADVVGAYDAGLASPRRLTDEHRDMVARAAAAAGGLVCIGNAVRRAADLAQVATTPADVVDATSAHTTLRQLPAAGASQAGGALVGVQPALHAGGGGGDVLTEGVPSEWHARRHDDDLRAYGTGLVGARDLSARAAASAAALHYIGLDIPTAALDAEVALSPAQAVEMQSESGQGGQVPPLAHVGSHHEPSRSSASQHVPWEVPEDPSVCGASIRTVTGTSVRSSIRESGYESSSSGSVNDAGHKPPHPHDPTALHRHAPRGSGSSYQWSDSFSYDTDLKETQCETHDLEAWSAVGGGSPTHSYLSTSGIARSDADMAEEAKAECTGTKLAEECLSEGADDEMSPSPMAPHHIVSPSSSPTSERSQHSTHSMHCREAIMMGESFQFAKGSAGGTGVLMSAFQQEAASGDVERRNVMHLMGSPELDPKVSAAALPRVRKQLDLVMHRRQFGDLSDQNVLADVMAGSGTQPYEQQHVAADAGGLGGMKGAWFSSWSSDTPSQVLMSPAFLSLEGALEGWDATADKEVSLDIGAEVGGDPTMNTLGRPSSCSIMPQAQREGSWAGDAAGAEEQVIDLITHMADRFAAIPAMAPSPSLLAETEPLLPAAIDESALGTQGDCTQFHTAKDCQGTILQTPSVNEPSTEVTASECYSTLQLPSANEPSLTEIAIAQECQGTLQPPSVNEPMAAVAAPQMLPVTAPSKDPLPSMTPHTAQPRAVRLDSILEQSVGLTSTPAGDAAAVQLNLELQPAGHPTAVQLTSELKSTGQSSAGQLYAEFKSTGLEPAAGHAAAVSRAEIASSAEMQMLPEQLGLGPGLPVHDPYDVYAGMTPDYYPLGGYVNYGPTRVEALPNLEAVIERRDPDLVPGRHDCVDALEPSNDAAQPVSCAAQSAHGKPIVLAMGAAAVRCDAVYHEGVQEDAVLGQTNVKIPPSTHASAATAPQYLGGPSAAAVAGAKVAAKDVASVEYGSVERAAGQAARGLVPSGVASQSAAAQTGEVGGNDSVDLVQRAGLELAQAAELGYQQGVEAAAQAAALVSQQGIAPADTGPLAQAAGLGYQQGVEAAQAAELAFQQGVEAAAAAAALVSQAEGIGHVNTGLVLAQAAELSYQQEVEAAAAAAALVSQAEGIGHVNTGLVLAQAAEVSYQQEVEAAAQAAGLVSQQGMAPADPGSALTQAAGLGYQQGVEAAQAGVASQQVMGTAAELALGPSQVAELSYQQRVAIAHATDLVLAQAAAGLGYRQGVVTAQAAELGYQQGLLAAAQGGELASQQGLDSVDPGLMLAQAAELGDQQGRAAAEMESTAGSGLISKPEGLQSTVPNLALSEAAELACGGQGRVVDQQGLQSTVPNLVLREAGELACDEEGGVVDQEAKEIVSQQGLQSVDPAVILSQAVELTGRQHGRGAAGSIPRSELVSQQGLDDSTEPGSALNQSVELCNWQLSDQEGQTAAQAEELRGQQGLGSAHSGLTSLQAAEPTYQEGVEQQPDAEWYDAQDSAVPAPVEVWSYSPAHSYSEDAVPHIRNTSIDVPPSSDQPTTEDPKAVPHHTQSAGPSGTGLTTGRDDVSSQHHHDLDAAHVGAPRCDEPSAGCPLDSSLDSFMSYSSTSEGGEDVAMSAVLPGAQVDGLAADGGADDVQLLDPPQIQMGVPAELVEMHDVVAEAAAAAACLVARGEAVHTAVEMMEPLVVHELGLDQDDGMVQPIVSRELRLDQGDVALLPQQPEFFFVDPTDPATEIDMSQITGHLQPTQLPSVSPPSSQQAAHPLTRHSHFHDATGSPIPGSPVRQTPSQPMMLADQAMEACTARTPPRVEVADCPHCVAATAASGAQAVVPQLEHLQQLPACQTEASPGLSNDQQHHIPGTYDDEGGLVSLTELMPQASTNTLCMAADVARADSAGRRGECFDQGVATRDGGQNMRDTCCQPPACGSLTEWSGVHGSSSNKLNESQVNNRSLSGSMTLRCRVDEEHLVDRDLSTVSEAFEPECGYQPGCGSQACAPGGEEHGGCGGNAVQGGCQDLELQEEEEEVEEEVEEGTVVELLPHGCRSSRRDIPGTPTLAFAQYEEMLLECQAAGISHEILGQACTIMSYADDIQALSSDPAHVATFMRIASVALAKQGQTLNMSKCRVLIISHPSARHVVLEDMVGGVQLSGSEKAERY